MRFRTSAKRILRPPYSQVIKLLESIERRLISKDKGVPYSPIFIVGVPRSGTTLLYQLFVYCFDVCYLSNLLAKYNRFPCVLSYFISLYRGPRLGEFRSTYGEVDGWLSPAQAWLFWARWFPSDQSYVGLGEIEEESVAEIRHTIGRLESIYKKPFVNKNLSLGVRLGPLNRALPEALYIRIHRDHLDVAQSILKGRQEYAGNINDWISVKPSKYGEIRGGDAISQVCEQIFYIEQDIDRDLDRIGRAKCLDVSYEKLCREPAQVLRDILAFYRKRTPLDIDSLRLVNDPPSSFPLSHGQKCDTDDYRKLKEGLERVFG